MAETNKSLFMKRWKFCKGGAETHPYALWQAVIDNRTARACGDLHGKVWRVDGETFADIVHNHFALKHKDCRCRISPVTMRAIVDEQIQRMD